MAEYLEWEEDANMAHPSYEECDRHPLGPAGHEKERDDFRQ